MKTLKKIAATTLTLLSLVGCVEEDLTLLIEDTQYVNLHIPNVVTLENVEYPDGTLVRYVKLDSKGQPLKRQQFLYDARPQGEIHFTSIVCLQGAHDHPHILGFFRTFLLN